MADHDVAADSRPATIGGLTALLLWSTTVALARSASEQVGPFTAAAGIYGVSTAAACIGLFFAPARLGELLRVPRLYLGVCGSLFIFYMVALYTAIGLAGDRLQTLVVALLNYLWPALTILLSVPLLRARARIWLLPGTILAIAGVCMVLVQGRNVSWGALGDSALANPVAYLLATLAAFAWALYSNLTRRWATHAGSGATELFLAATALVMLLLSFIANTSHGWTLRAVAEVAGMGVANWLAYSLWDNAMRRGNMSLVVAASYGTPLLSTIVSCLYLGVSAGNSLWLGCLLLIAGSFLSWMSIRVPSRVQCASQVASHDPPQELLADH
jgi:drug/metabolite transporter (DMT)-like permease